MDWRDSLRSDNQAGPMSSAHLQPLEATTAFRGEADPPAAMAPGVAAKAEKASEQPPSTSSLSVSTATPLASSTPLDAAASNKPTVKMEGYLEKKGKMRVVAMWKRYWFVLEGRLLLYYKSQQEYARLSPCRGSLNMGLASCVRPGAGPDHHVLEVVLRSHVVSLRAKERSSQEQWLKALLDSMATASTTTAPGKPAKEAGKGPLHFRYPSADNLSKAESPLCDDGDAGTQREKHRTLPNWRGRTPSSEPHKMPGSEVHETPEDSGRFLAELDIVPRKVLAGKGAHAKLARQGSILPILGKQENPSHPGSPRALHGQDPSPFGNQRYSFHGFRKAENATPNGSSVLQMASGKGRQEMANKPKGFKNFESVLKKQLSFSSPSSEKDSLHNKNDIKSTQILEENLKTSNGSADEKLSCKFCHRNLRSEGEKCYCLKVSTPLLEEDKENVLKWKPDQDTPKFHSDENQNQLFKDTSFEQRKASSGRKYSGSERDLLLTPGVDLSFQTPDGHEFARPVRCTSADELWSPPKKSFKDIHIKHSKFNQMGPDAQYFSVTDIDNASHTLESRRSEPVGIEKNKLAKMSLCQRLIHGNGEYIKYSEPEDCDKRDSTLNTTIDSHAQDVKAKSKLRLRKRKGSTAKDSYSLADNFESSNKKRVPVRSRLSFLTRVLSHVRRTKSEDVMDHPETEGLFSDDAFLSPHPDLQSKCRTPVSRMLEDMKKMESGPNFQLGPSNPVFGEAPEEPPPDYDSVGVEPVAGAGDSSNDEPPQLPPRRMKRPRSPWHDVPTNNSPVIDLDNDARQRLLSAAKYGRVIGTRTSHSMDFYDWSDPHPSDHSQHHAYEVVSDDTSPAGSNEHLAIYLSSESSDEEFHEDVVLRRNIRDGEFLFGIQDQPNPFGNITSPSAMEPLTISTDMLPMLDESGRVGLSHVEAMKLNLLMQAQRTSTDLVKKQQEKRDRQKSSSIVTEDIVQADRFQFAAECLQKPPEEFADKDELALNEVIESSEKAVAEVQCLLSPTKETLNTVSNSLECDDRGGTESQDSVLTTELPPSLPTKKVKGLAASCSEGGANRHSDELNDLLAQLAGMTTAPLLPVGATCSLQVGSRGPDGESASSTTAHKQSLSLEVVGNMYDSEPDYDIPRPHASLLQILPQSGRPFPEATDEGMKATHFFSRPESPRQSILGDQSCSGHMSPDSLDFPFMPTRHSLNWDMSNVTLGHVLDTRDLPKPRIKKDRSRRATLNGPITQQTVECALNFNIPLLRRNSMELSSNETETSNNQRDRSANELKQVKRLSAYEAAICEHSSTLHKSSSQPTCIGKICKKLDVSLSLEDISEKSELNSDSVASDAITNVRSLPKLDEVDMDSLEASEFKKSEVLEGGAKTLVSIVEESDVLSDKSEDDPSTGSASEGAVMLGNSNNSATDQLTTQNTDSDLEMLSEDESEFANNQKGHHERPGKLIEPDSLLSETILLKKLDIESSTLECESTKDTSLEIDSLELKK
ncbi:uncharacterized protein LOC117651619 [Thrips palmi]|uniref:Uncharacterized protein LOC117651619 n=1 Tax=Thrips palmi TaxID=161013 RepID=A0A6P9A2P0_THRPL|nr:uncharacterized protein LOC117651619 [Thrips palmi]